MLNVDMELFYDLEQFYIGDSGEVRAPTSDELDQLVPTAPRPFCDNTNRAFAVCFPERSGTDTHDVVSTFEDNGNGVNEEFLDLFAAVFDKLISRVTDGADLTTVQLTAPEDWPPASIFNGGGRSSSSSDGFGEEVIDSGNQVLGGGSPSRIS